MRQENPVQKGTLPSRERGAAAQRLADAALVTPSDTRAVDGGSGPEEKVKLKMLEFERWSLISRFMSRKTSCRREVMTASTHFFRTVAYD